MSLHNRTSLDFSCGGNLLLKPPIDAIKIIEDICSNPYSNTGDRRIMKRDVRKDDSQTELEKQMQDLTLNIETLTRAQDQVPITTPSVPTYDRCGIMHGP